MARIIFILGGARIVKSAFAEALAKKYHDVIYIATAEAKDDEMRERIQTHRSRRPIHWKTIESPYAVDKVVSEQNGQAGLIFIDCVTLYITNMLLKDETATIAAGLGFHGGIQKQEQILEEIKKLVCSCRESGSDIIIVSNEVGLGIVPDNFLSRMFRDIAGYANQIIADEADEVYFVVAGIAQRIK
jgi:adenosylcobinamide kinase / adenosylcobinamide-phosphate guanylyltransferase